MRKSVKVAAISFLSLVCLSSGALARTITLQAWSVDGYSPNREVFLKAVDDFEKSHPNITIKASFGDWISLTQKYLTATAGGISPDLYNVNLGGSGELVWGDLFRPLDQYMKADGIKNSEYVKSTLEPLTVDGHLYGLPTHTDARGIVYNKGMFARAGLDDSKGPRTWNEFKEYQMKLTQRLDGQKFNQVGIMPFSGEAVWIFYWGWMLGGSSWDTKNAKITLDNPKNVEALKYLMSLTAPFGKEFLANGPKVGGLTGNKLAMEVGGLWYLPGLAKVKNIQFGVCDLPIPEGGQHSTIGGGFGWSISKGSKHPKEAWQFVKWMAGYEGQTRLFPGIGAIPSHLKAQKFVYEKVDSNSRAFFEMADYVRQFPNFPGSFKLLQALPGKIYDAFSGKLTPDQALKQAQPDAQRLWTVVAKRRK